MNRLRKADPGTGRLVPFFGLAILVLMGVTMLAASGLFKAIQVEEEDRLCNAITALLAESVSRVSFSGKYQARLLIEELLPKVPVLRSIALEDPQGRIQAHSDPRLNDTLVSAEEKETAARCIRLKKALSREVLTPEGAARQIVLPYYGGYNQELLGVIRVSVGVEASRAAEQQAYLRLVLLILGLAAAAVAALSWVSVRSHRQIKTLASQLEGILGQAPLSVVIQDSAETVLNRSAEYDRYFDAYWEGLDPGTREDLRRTVFEENRLFQKEVELPTKQGPRRFELLRFPIRGPRDQEAEACTILHDVTEARRAAEEILLLNQDLETRVAKRTEELSKTLEDLGRAQNELVRSEKLASLGSLVAGIAHELNTPIGICVTLASNLDVQAVNLERELAEGLRKSTLDTFLSDLRESATLMARELERAADLINNFKQVAIDQSSERRREFDLNQVLLETCQTMQLLVEKQRHTLVHDLDRTVLLDSYPGSLSQILINLINNALLHAFPPGTRGTITVRTQVLSGDQVEVSVRDDGVGIPPAHHQKIFEPFFTTKLGKGGTGLGLHICHNQVYGVLGGSLSLESSPGAGAVFRIRIPLAAPAAKGS